MRGVCAGRRAWRVAVLGVLALAAGPGGASARASGCPNASASATAIGMAAARAAVACEVNARRRAHGRRPLRWSGRLGLAAERHSLDMVARRFFAHVSPGGATLDRRVRRTGYLHGAHSWILGEDIGWAEEPIATARRIVRSWMHSPPHRSVILDGRFRQIGVGVAGGVPDASARGGATFVIDLGRCR
jgi:uncharacterized protein YkwD